MNNTIEGISDTNTNVMNFKEEMEALHSYVNHHLISFPLNSDSILYFQVFYTINDTRKYIIFRLWVIKSPNKDIRLDELRSFAQRELLELRLSRIFSTKTHFSEFRFFDSSKTIDTGEIPIYGVYGKLSGGSMEGPVSFQLRTINPKNSASFKLSGISHLIRNRDSPKEVSPFRTAYIPFQAFFTSILENEDSSLQFRCVGVHVYNKRSRPSNCDTHVLNVKPTLKLN